MADTRWIIDIDSKIYSIIKAKTESVISADYPDVFYTNSNANPISAQFPTIYIHGLTPIENNQILDGNTIESAMFTFEVQIKSNEDIDTINDVACYIIDAFKELRFSVTYAPTPFESAGVFMGTYRFRRNISSKDNI